MVRPWSSASGRQNSTRSLTVDRASHSGERSARTGRRASLTIASIERWSTPMCVCRRWASSGSAIASASRRSAVTGVRRRWERSPTAARSVASSSVIRSASPLSAWASSWVSTGPTSSARAPRSPSRRRWAVCETARSGALTRRPSCQAMATAKARSSPPVAMMPVHARVTPCRRSAGPTWERTTAVPLSTMTGSSTRPPSSSTTVNASPWQRSADLGVRRQVSTSPQLASVGGQHAGHGRAAAVDPLDELGQLVVVAHTGDEDRDVARLLVGGRHRAVLGQGLDQEAQRDDEGDDDGRRRRDDQQ